MTKKNSVLKFVHSDSYRNFLDLLIESLAGQGSRIKPGEYSKLFEIAIEKHALSVGVKAPPRLLVANGGARPGAGRPRKSVEPARDLVRGSDGAEE